MVPLRALLLYPSLSHMSFAPWLHSASVYVCTEYSLLRIACAFSASNILRKLCYTLYSYNFFYHYVQVFPALPCVLYILYILNSSPPSPRPFRWSWCTQTGAPCVQIQVHSHCCATPASRCAHSCLLVLTASHWCTLTPWCTQAVVYMPLSIDRLCFSASNVIGINVKTCC